MAATASSLPLGTRLGELELTGVLGEGGFSVVYVALDHALERTVAVKEYIPSSIATRSPDGLVLPRSPKHEDTFKAGLASFINEARFLARFNHPALIHVHRVWEQNGTAYMAMQYCRGKTLRQVLQTEPALVKNEGWLKATFAPILDALELLHANHCFHRDLSPENIIVLQNGAPILLDFGAARQVIGDMVQTLTVILKPGFAPIEQYADDSSLEQGAWTDVYGVGAVLYFLLMGKPPVASVARLVKDPMAKLTDVKELDWVSPAFRKAVDQALAVHPNQRIRSIAELRDALQLPTFRPDAQFGGLFPIPSSVVPKTVTGEEASRAALPTVPGAMSSLHGGNAAYAPLEHADVSLVDQKSDAAKESPALANASLPQRKVWAIQHPWTLLAGVFVVVILTVAIGFFLASGWHSDDNKSIVAESELKTQESLEDTSNSKPATQNTSEDVQKNALPVIPDTIEPVASQAEKAASEVLQVGTAVQKGGPDDPSQAANQKNSLNEPVKGAGTSGSTTLTPTLPKLSSSSAPAASAQQQQNNKQPEPGIQTKPILPANNQQVERPTAAASKPQSSASQSQSQSLVTVRFSIRPWGYISVDGQPKGISPPLNRLELTPGHHTVIISNHSFAPVEKEIAVTYGKPLVISHRFGDE